MAHQPAESLFHLMGLHIGGDFDSLTFFKTKKGKLTWFLKAPPTCPPSDKQTVVRNQFRLVAILWNALTDDERTQWNLTTTRLSLCMTGYNLFTHFATKIDPAALQTLQRQAQTVLA